MLSNRQSPGLMFLSVLGGAGGQRAAPGASRGAPMQKELMASHNSCHQTIGLYRAAVTKIHFSLQQAGTMQLLYCDHRTWHMISLKGNRVLFIREVMESIARLLFASF